MEELHEVLFMPPMPMDGDMGGEMGGNGEENGGKSYKQYNNYWPLVGLRELNHLRECRAPNVFIVTYWG